MKQLETTVEEVLRAAIQSEVQTRAYYEKMAERTKLAHVRKRLLELAEEEIKHRAVLEQKYRDTMRLEPPLPNPPSIELPADIQNLTMSRALKLALERERESESNFRFMAERVPSTTDLGRLFVELAEIEWKHKTDLQAEYDAATTDPETFLLDI